MPAKAKNVGPYCLILDVGHGNAAIFVDGRSAIVVDAGPGDLVASTLADHGVAEIAALVISHRHHDHTSELPSLLSDPALVIHRLFVNSDPNRDPTTRFERDLRAGFNDSHARNNTMLISANTTVGALMGTEALNVQVLAPHTDDAFGGVGAHLAGGGELHAHAMAVVLRVATPEGRSVLLCADHDYDGFRRMLDDESVDLRATVVVYPHHGGLSGAPDEGVFAAELAAAADPDLVVFSHGRNSYDNPRPEVIRGVRAARDGPAIRIMCTQLSKNCAAAHIAGGEHLDPSLASRGAVAGHSCSGSLRVTLAPGEPLLPHGAAHLDFVLHQVDGRLCMGAAPDA